MRYLKLIKRIKKNEGFSSIPYKDQLGFLTIGYGHLILSEEKYLIETKQTKTKLEKLFIQDFKKPSWSLYGIEENPSFFFILFISFK